MTALPSRRGRGRARGDLDPPDGPEQQPRAGLSPRPCPCSARYALSTIADTQDSEQGRVPLQTPARCLSARVIDVCPFTSKMVAPDVAYEIGSTLVSRHG